MSLWKNRESRALPTTLDPYQISARPLFRNYSGEIVDEYTAFAHSAFMGAVGLLADCVAVLPIEIYRDRGGRTERVATPSVFIKPNEHQTMFEFVHQIVLMLAIHGNAYIYAPRNPGEPPIEMRVLHPNKVACVYDDQGQVIYKWHDNHFTSKEVKAISWMTIPGTMKSLSPLESMRNTLGMGLAMDRFLSQFYGEGATPSSVLETDSALTEDQARILRDTWEDAHWKKRRPAVLTAGLKWRSITTSASDMEMMAHRESIVRDIARCYRIPLHMIAGSGGDSQTYQNVEQSGINFVRYTLLPWLKRCSDGLSDLLPLTQKVRFDTTEFEKADLTTRVKAQQVMISSGTLTPNEARHIENREPYDGGDQFVLTLPGAPIAGIEGGAIPTLGTDAEPPAR